MPQIFLSDRGVVRVGGDAVDFLHRVITCSMLDFQPGEARYGALLSPQGKLAFDFLVVPLLDTPGFYFDCDRTQAADLAKRLNFFKLRAKVTVEDMSDRFGVAAAWGDDRVRLDGLRYADPRAASLGERLIAPRDDLAALGSDVAAYEAARIAAGIPKGGIDFPFGDTFIHDANLDLLHGVDFKKGCYVGQEVVARVQYRGSARKRIARLHFDGPPPSPGAEITAGDVGLGQLTSTSGDDGLAMLRIDRLDEAQKNGTPLRAGSAAVSVALPR